MRQMVQDFQRATVAWASPVVPQHALKSLLEVELRKKGINNYDEEVNALIRNLVAEELLAEIGTSSYVIQQGHFAA